MVEKDTIEEKVTEKKEKVEEKINEKKEKAEEKINQQKEKYEERKEKNKVYSEKIATDFSKNIDELKESFKNFQKTAEEKMTEYGFSSLSSLSADLVETEDTYYLKVAVPGIEKEDVDIQASDNDIVITATFKPLIEEVEAVENGKVIASELKTGKCSKTVRFENSIEVDKITAKYNIGTVIITLPKLIIPKHKVTVE